MSLTRIVVGLAACGLVVWFVGAKLVHGYVDASYAALNAPASVLQDYHDRYGGACDVAVVRLDNYELDATEAETGGYAPSAEDIVKQIDQARDDASIKGLVLLVNSPGGSVPAGEMIASALQGLGKPSAAVILDMGDSAAYFAASGASRIFASAFSDVGDIGVTSSFVNTAGANSKNGDVFEQISSGKYKDAGNPDKPLTDDERALLQRNVDEMFQHLVDEIAANRHMATSTVLALSDGSSMPGTLALEKGLIDELGDESSAATWIASDLKKKSVTLCD
ncbi:MAG: S49 family peptidase [Patescibacteria group bacterium]|nr:S49 family peptidase [Patescibacteria group bacterium]MDE1944205.1 S49 family peptidase [Patescibacteria group bacterium]MDE1944920.1 S49 family peptidase [Patescibacteria group bacterium]MDE2057441.1 S49 family peptidase [Patescibacteria group bacterium]